MDFQQTVDSFSARTCIISVEDLGNGAYGKIRIVTGNQAYLDTFNAYKEDAANPGAQFVPNSEYTRYVPRDLNFEHSCYRAAVQKELLHSYVHPGNLDAWMDMTYIPLTPDDGNICYCAYTMEISRESNAESMSNVNGELAAAVLQTTLRLSTAPDFTAAIWEIIRDIRRLCEAEFCYILLTDPIARRGKMLCRAAADPSRFGDYTFLETEEFYEITKTWADTIAGSNCLVVKNEQDMDYLRAQNPVWQATLERAGIRAIVLFPLKNRGELLGYMWATNFDATRAAQIKEALELTTFILGTEIANFLLLQRLQVLSSKDMLTGVYNRNEMNERVIRLSEGTEGVGVPIGVVFADLNGLKAVNDAEGHNAGDKLLCDAACALREVFSETDIYRAGGDEFAMILSGADAAELAEKERLLREAAQRYDKVHFAIGWCTRPDGRQVRSALRTADGRMYADKREYYESHPELDRRTH